MLVSIVCFFFFKQKTAYEMRISDWSSDVCSSDLTLIVRSVEDSIARGTVALRKASDSRNAAQATTLLEAIEEFGFDACIGGARRDEEKARAKERVFSFRNEFGQWDPKAQRPELWNLFNKIGIASCRDRLGQFV